MMNINQLMLPSDDEFIEHIAKAIAKEKLTRESVSLLEEISGYKIDSLAPGYEKIIDDFFEQVWQDQNRISEIQRESFRKDARAAISAINLKLLTMT